MQERKTHKVIPLPAKTENGNLNIEGHQILLRNTGNFNIIIDGYFIIRPGKDISLENIYPDIYKINTKIAFVDLKQEPKNPRLDILITNVEGETYNYNNHC